MRVAYRATNRNIRFPLSSVNARAMNEENKYAATRHWLLEGGELLAVDALPLSDRGFRYGMHLFETLAVRHGRIAFLQEHLVKLAEQCRQLGYPFDSEIHELVAAARAQAAMEDGVLRLHVTAGDGNLDDPVVGPRVLLTAQPSAPFRLPLEPAILISYPTPHQLVPAGAKSGNYWQHAMAAATARSAGATDAILATPDNHLICVATGNLFLDVGGQWLTPDGSSGRRAGVVHDWLLGRLSVQMRQLDVTIIKQADAALVCNSRVGPRSVGSIDGRPLQQTIAQQQIIDEYWQEIQKTTSQADL